MNASTACKKDLSSSSQSKVHHIETNLHKPPASSVNKETVTYPNNYHAYLQSFDPDEYRRTEALYSMVDATDGKDRIELLHGCRARAWFTRHEETHKVKVVSNQCRLRWCPLCARARSSFIVQGVTDYLKNIDGAKFLTLTLKHSNAPLEHQVKSLYKFFVNFRRRPQIKKNIRGGIWFFQIHRSESSGQWHPHIHCLIDANFISKLTLSKIWQQVTLKSTIIDIRKVRDEKEAAAYVSRDCARPTRLENLGPDDWFELYNALHRRRICGTWGNARQVPLKSKPLEEKNAWQKIGSWQIVTELQDSHPAAKQILMAWKLNKPLESNISLSDFDDFIDGQEQRFFKKQKQLFLEFQ